ncbi:serine hydrolase domain-containing protein [Mucisphaera calidilacus]|uniref:Penicillin-binding protein PbpX n=1 Tax=Mucisphaera calidilacus TaxID=2527982 RepID=A0A518BXC3_9BACT|nr:serine hydrolase domain-containing protein [Mucisphaera calidilacus]QDU71594.1 Putative penicillin-binding protein PbpX [Mucisphaera calidilacus]
MLETSLGRAGQLVEAGIERGQHLGAQIAISFEGTISHCACYGEMRPGQHMARNTILPWLSATKAIAAVAIAQLWELGRIDLDAPVASVIPEFATHGKQRVTTRHILTHTGGFRAAPYEFPRDDWQTILNTIYESKREPDWTPGEKAGYHITTSWFILGEIVQRVSGQTYPDFVRSHIFEPLRMDDCWIGMPEDVYDQNADRIGIVPDTARRDAPPRDWTGKPFLTGCSPASNGCGPAVQFVRFYRALCDGGELDGQRILEPETIQLFTARHRVNLFDHTFKANMDWGLGFILDSKDYGKEVVPYGYGPHASHYAFGHSGNQSSAAFADPAHGIAIVILWNGTPGEPVHQERVHRTLGAIYEDLELA